jgi:hydroxyacylglutathione hydrolase
MYFKQIFDEKLAQYSYIIGCQKNGEAMVIDPMRDIDTYIQIAAKENLKIVAAADTHIHADYLSGLRELAERGVKVYASDEGDKDWKYEWLMNSKYNYQLLKDGDTFYIGNIKFKAWHTPGHTPEHLSYFVTDGAAADEPLGIATGDFVFVGDVGRPDLLESAAGHTGNMEPSARRLYKTVEEFKHVPEYLQIWPGHGAGSACGKALGAIPESTVGYELRFNQSIRASSSEDNFVKFILDGQPEPPMYFARMKRDNKLGPNVLGSLPNPKHLSQLEISGIVGKNNSVIVDTRSKEAFAAMHLPGSLLSTLNKQFNTIVGSFVEETEQIYLVVEHAQVQEAVIDLVRIGLDNIVGYVTTADLELYAQNGGEVSSMKAYKFEEVANLSNDDDYAVLDVRKATEFALGNMPGAQNIAHTRLHVRVNEVPRDKKLIVHCQAGGRSAVAGAYLKRAGFDVLFVDDKFENYEALASANA